MFKVGLMVRVLFDNGVERGFTETTHIDYKTKQEAREYIDKAIGRFTKNYCGII